MLGECVREFKERNSNKGAQLKTGERKHLELQGVQTIHTALLGSGKCPYN